MTVEEAHGNVRGREYHGLVYSVTDDKGNKVGNPFKSSLFGKSVGYEAVQKKFARSKQEFKERKLADMTKRTVLFVLDSKKLRDFGLNQTSVYLGERPGDKIAPEKEIVVSAVLLPSFDKLTAEQKEQAPKVELSTTDLNLGNFNGKKKLKGEILVSNKSKSVLDIRSMQMFTMGLQVKLKKSKLLPGETVKMKVTAVAADLKKSRAKHPRILMITNDPENAKVVIRINVK